jgi:hypothetical protein
MEDYSKKSNNDLLVLMKQKKDEWERVKQEIIKTYDYWVSLESDYNGIIEELNKRNVQKV